MEKVEIVVKVPAKRLTKVAVMLVKVSNRCLNV